MMVTALLLCNCLAAQTLSSPTITSSSGGGISNNYMLSWTLGEFAVQTRIGSSLIVSEGL